MPLAAALQVIVGGSPYEISGTLGKMPTTPMPFAAALTAEATSVPCAPVIAGGPLRICVWAPRSGRVVSTKSSTIPTDTFGAGGGTVGGTTAPRAQPAGAPARAPRGGWTEVGAGLHRGPPAPQGAPDPPPAAAR